MTQTTKTWVVCDLCHGVAYDPDPDGWGEPCDNCAGSGGKWAEVGETERARAARALLVNATLLRAYFIREKIKPDKVPDVRWFSPQEAEAASVRMRDTDLGKRVNPDGSTTLTCFVEPTRVTSLYAWALAAWADGEGAESHG